MRAILFVLIFLLVSGLALRIPFVGYSFYYWLTISNAGYFAYAPPYSWTKFAAVITLVSFLIFELKRCEHVFSPIFLAIVAIAIWINITTYFALYPEAAAALLEKELKVLLMVVIGTLLLSTPARLQAMIWVIQAAMVIYAVNGTILMITGQVGATPGVPGTLVGHTNEAARALLYTIPLAMYLRVTSDSVWLRWVALALAVLLSLSLLGTGSRGATVAFFLIASLGILKSQYRLRWLGVTGVVLTIGAFLTTTVAFQNWWARFGSTSNYDEDASFQGRVEVWNYALELIRAKPIVGGGFNVYEELFEVASHNSYFEWAGEHGLVGLGLFLLLIFVVWRAAESTIAKTKDRKDLAWAWHLMQASRYILIAYLVSSLTKNDGFNELLLLNIAIVEGTRRVVNAKLAGVKVDAVRGEAAGRLIDEGKPT